MKVYKRIKYEKHTFQLREAKVLFLSSVTHRHDEYVAIFEWYRAFNNELNIRILWCEQVFIENGLFQTFKVFELSTWRPARLPSINRKDFTKILKCTFVTTVTEQHYTMCYIAHIYRIYTWILRRCIYCYSIVCILYRFVLEMHIYSQRMERWVAVYAKLHQKRTVETWLLLKP